VKARLASGNAHKLEELRAALPGWELESFGALAFPPETGETFAENARAKAQFGREHLAERDSWVLGEDSGIEAVALGGRPGIESARWAEDGVARLLAELAGASDRRARYVCALVALGPAGESVEVEGTLEGSIADAPRGSEGFGYDPIFVPTGLDRTVAELGNEWKSRNSHRARAAAALVQALGK